MVKLAKQEGESVLWDRKAACWSEVSPAPAVGPVCLDQVWAGVGDAKSCACGHGSGSNTMRDVMGSVNLCHPPAADGTHGTREEGFYSL